jgi:hypothetical protein
MATMAGQGPMSPIGPAKGPGTPVRAGLGVKGLGCWPGRDVLGLGADMPRAGKRIPVAAGTETQRP